MFSNARHKPTFEIKCGDQKINKVSSAKYLGVILDDALNWKDHVELISKKLKTLLSALYYIARFIDKTHVNRIYNAYIHPHIRYGIELYGSCASKLLRRVQFFQNRYLKILYN